MSLYTIHKKGSKWTLKCNTPNHFTLSTRDYSYTERKCYMNIEAVACPTYNHAIYLMNFHEKRRHGISVKALPRTR